MFESYKARCNFLGWSNSCYLEFTSKMNRLIIWIDNLMKLDESCFRKFYWLKQSYIDAKKIDSISGKFRANVFYNWTSKFLAISELFNWK
jgi:hypothetical protein